MLPGCQGVASKAGIISIRAPPPAQQLRFGPSELPLRPSRPQEHFRRAVCHHGLLSASVRHSSQQQQQQPLPAESADIWTSAIGTAAVLIVDATNRAQVSAADARAYAHVGDTLPAVFEAWLAFLRDLLQPTLCIAVFDAPQVPYAEPSEGTA